MRLSIWRQFASNHSGFFWVVGTFESVPDAHHAFEELREMFFEIDRWHREHRDDSWALLLSNTVAPPEIALGKKLQIEWTETIDWTGWASYHMEGDSGFDVQKSAESLINEAIRLAGRNIILTSPHQTWMKAALFRDMLRALGADAFGYDAEFAPKAGFDLYAILSFTAPDDETADAIEAAVARYVAGDLTDLPPWHEDEANFQQVLGTSEYLKLEAVNLLRENWRQRYQFASGLPYAQTLLKERLALRQIPEIIRREGLRFTWQRFSFHNNELGVSALIAWLEVNGCKDIDYHYVVKDV